MLSIKHYHLFPLLTWLFSQMNFKQQESHVLGDLKLVRMSFSLSSFISFLELIFSETLDSCMLSVACEFSFTDPSDQVIKVIRKFLTNSSNLRSIEPTFWFTFSWSLAEFLDPDFFSTVYMLCCLWSWVHCFSYPVADNLYDVFVNIRDDEAEHCKTMKACQTHGNLRSPHSMQKCLETDTECVIPEDDCEGIVDCVKKSLVSKEWLILIGMECVIVS